MKQMMTYHNIRNMIYQLMWSGGYWSKFNYSNHHVDDCKVEFDYSDDTDVKDHVSCVMVDGNMNGYEIIIKIVMFRNGMETELNVRLRGNDKDDVMTCDGLEDGYAAFRRYMHMIHHKATKRLIKRIYERMIIPMMNREICEHLKRRKENAEL